ncbi:hypothetical protein [Enterococcus ureasiticus]|uniref:Uncharacterized protein n=1 Tax=Enterococcus ureasiticus TaxID=903984 RepID=A0A1E5GGY2_9ENTE|nr:hypothetical protein [Enterococcus ureasiticus]OEG11978.1 hypothetical protein BCR21_07005 [Enterococcus ureasiticus]
MKEDLKFIYNFISSVNSQKANKLLKEETLADTKENVYESLDTDFTNMEIALKKLKSIDILSNNFEDEIEFKHGMAYLGMALIDISNDIAEMNDMLGELVQNLNADEGS